MLWGTLALCGLAGVAAQSDTCPQFPPTNTVVETAPGCKHSVEIPFLMKSHVYTTTQIAILDVQPPGSSLTVEKAFALIEDSEGIKNLPFTAILKWTPRLDDAGLPKEFAIRISSTALECASASHTVLFRVFKCEYCINEMDSMHSIATRFSTHWTQIWSSNHELETPDQVTKGQRIKLGNMYQTVKGDTWKLMAVRFGTTVERLLELNPDLVQYSQSDMVALVPQDTDVCVMPETCPTRRASFPGVTW